MFRINYKNKNNNQISVHKCDLLHLNISKDKK